MKRESESIDPEVLSTVESFVDEIAWGEFRSVLVYRRRYRGRDYVKVRVWNRHRTRGFRYPSPRGFVLAREIADALAEAIKAAAAGRTNAKPVWVTEREQAEAPRIAWMQEVEAPKEVIKRAKKNYRRRRRQYT